MKEREKKKGGRDDGQGGKRVPQPHTGLPHEGMSIKNYKEAHKRQKTVFNLYT